MSTDAWIEEHWISEAVLPRPRRAPKHPALPVPHAPTCSRGNAPLPAHAQSRDRARHPGDGLSASQDGRTWSINGTKAGTNPHDQVANVFPAVETMIPPQTSGPAAPRPSPGLKSQALVWLHNHADRRALFNPSLSVNLHMPKLTMPAARRRARTASSSAMVGASAVRQFGVTPGNVSCLTSRRPQMGV